MTKQLTTLRFDGEELFLVEGTLTELQTARTSVNLLAQIEQRLQAKNLATGIAAAVSGMHGMLANSAMLALYDGEDMHNFAALVGDHVICGVFEHADRFKNGDKIKAVVSKRGDVLYTHAITNTNSKLLYMPLTTFAGEKAFFRGCMRVAWRFSIFLWIFMGIAIFAIGGPWQFYIFTLIFGPTVMFPMEYWTYRSTRYFGERASAIFKVLGFPRPDDIDLSRNGSMYFGNEGWHQGWQYERMLEKHKAKYGIKE
jgi:hypothetical protein